MIEHVRDVRELKWKGHVEDDKTKYRRVQLSEGGMEKFDLKEKLALQFELEQKEKERRVAEEMHYYQLQRLMGKVSELMIIHDRKEEGFRMLIQGLEEQLMDVTRTLHETEDRVLTQTRTRTQELNESESESPSSYDRECYHHMRNDYDNADYSVREDVVIEEEREVVEEEREEEAGSKQACSLMTISNSNDEGIHQRQQQTIDIDVTSSKDRDRDRNKDRGRDGDRDRNKDRDRIKDDDRGEEWEGDRDGDRDGEGDCRGDGEQKSTSSPDETYDNLHVDRTSHKSAFHPSLNTHLSSQLSVDPNKSESAPPTLHSSSLQMSFENTVTKSFPSPFASSSSSSPFSSSFTSSSSSFPSCITSPAASSTSVSPAEHNHHHPHHHDHHHEDGEGDKGNNENVRTHVEWENQNLDLSAAVDSCSLEKLRERIVLRKGVSESLKKEISQ